MIRLSHRFFALSRKFAQNNYYFLLIFAVICVNFYRMALAIPAKRLYPRLS
jgi:hypothetical protein